MKCKDERNYSHCQEYYLFQVHKDQQLCFNFAPTPCPLFPLPLQVVIHDHAFTGVTLVNQLSWPITHSLNTRLDRVDRFPYLLSRWKGPISTVLFIKENEVEKLAEFVVKQERSGIDYSVYVIKNTARPFIRWNGRIKEYPYSIYPFNILRDIGIDSIRTTHYLLLDIDVLPSASLYDDIETNRRILMASDHNVLLFQLFQFNRALIKKQKTIQQFHELYLSFVFITVDGSKYRVLRRSCLVLWRKARS